MTARIDLDVVVDVLPCLGVKAGLGLADIAGAVDGSGSAYVLQRLPGAAEQNDFAAGNRRGVVRRRIGRVAHKIGKAVSAAVRPRIRVGVACGAGGIYDIERVDIVMLRLTWLNWRAEIGMQRDVE